MDRTEAHSTSASFPLRVRVRFLPWICAIVFLIFTNGCAHYPITHPSTQSDPRGGYRAMNFKHMGIDNDVLVMLTFSGGGTRAAAFSYGVLEALRDTEISIHGSRKRMLDEVDFISGVSGGSFTAAYYGLFGDRIFEDFESRFLKKNIQGELIRGILFNPVNWAKLSSPYYGRSDLAADYYDKNVFDHGTFGDILAHGGPMVVINATDMTLGTRFSFIQDPFDAICSDLCSFSVARACAASSAVPVLLSPVTLRNYAGKCGFQLPPALAEVMKPPREVTSRRFDLANNMLPFLDSQKKPYFHLVDGGGCGQSRPTGRSRTRHADGRPLDHFEICQPYKRAQNCLRGGECRNRNRHQMGSFRDESPLRHKTCLILLHSNCPLQHGHNGAPERKLPSLGR